MRNANVSVKWKLQHAPPGHTPSIWHLCRPGEEGIWLSESSRGWGIWSPCFRGGEFELHSGFHVKSLAWRPIMGIPANSLGFPGSLQVFHQISRIKWTFEHFCALVWNLVHFFTKLELFSQWWKRILIPCTSCKTSYNVLNILVGAVGVLVLLTFGGGGGGV